MELTPEQLAELQEKATRAEQLEKYKGESEAKLKEYEAAKSAWEQQKAELEQAANPNWQKTRQTISAMKTALKEKGVEVDDEGNVKGTATSVDLEKIKAEAAAAARGEVLGYRLNELLSEYDESSAKVVRAYFDKLTAGEVVTLQNIPNFIQQAESVARVGQREEIKKIQTAVGGGQGTRKPEEGVLSDEKMEELGRLMGLNFRKK